MELGMLTIEPRTIDMVALAKEETRTFSVFAREKNLLIRESYTAEIFAAMDPRLLQIILHNLLSNAVKYTPRGGEITLSIEQQASRILIQVADTGEGIPEAQQKHIFSKFFRAANAHKADPNGTGFGLYIVKSIVSGAGGDIWFESKVKTGTTFYVAFPLSGMKKVSGNTRL